MDNKDRSTNDGETQVLSNDNEENLKFFVKQTLLQFDLLGDIVNIIADYHSYRVYFFSYASHLHNPIGCANLEFVLELISKPSHAMGTRILKEHELSGYDIHFRCDERKYDGLICSGLDYPSIMKTLTSSDLKNKDKSHVWLGRFPLLGYTFQTAGFSIYLEFLNDRTIMNSESCMLFIDCLFYQMCEFGEDIFEVLRVLRDMYSEADETYIKPLPSVLVIWQKNIANCSSEEKRIIYEAERSNAAKETRRVSWDSIYVNSSMFLVLRGSSAGRIVEKFERFGISFTART